MQINSNYIKIKNIEITITKMQVTLNKSKNHKYEKKYS